VRIEPLEGACTLDSFTFAASPLSQIGGSITASNFAELLTDVRAEVFRDERLVFSGTTRNPVNGKWSVSGLPPGSYRIRLTAAGWKPREITTAIHRAGQKVDVGVVVLGLEPALQSKLWYGPFGYGHSASVVPASTFTARIGSSGYLTAASLASPYRVVPLTFKTESPSTSDAGDVTFAVPPGTPHDMYALRMVFQYGKSEYQAELAQSVAVREPLPEKFHIAGVGHMNTWGQQTSEYLAKVATMAQLAGARTFMIANEVNAIYIAGAMKDLRIPYLAARGNHSMARWDDFFGPRTFAMDDGPQRFVVFNDLPDQSWRDPGDLLAAREAATNRVLLAYEAFMPIAAIEQSRVDLLFDGHSDENHPDRAKFPAGLLHMRAPGQETMRWIAMDRQGLDPRARTTLDVPVLNIPHDGPAPLRAEYSNRNDGTAGTQTVRLINETGTAFEQARLRLVLRAEARTGGEYAVSGGRVLQSFLSDDGKVRVLDVEVAVAANSVAIVGAAPLPH
jgi:hypothetical protein